METKTKKRGSCVLFATVDGVGAAAAATAAAAAAAAAAAVKKVVCGQT